MCLLINRIAFRNGKLLICELKDDNAVDWDARSRRRKLGLNGICGSGNLPI
jgi:hypothetical protein